MPARTILNKIEVEVLSGNVSVRLKKEGGGSDGWHRTIIIPGVSVTDQMAAVSIHLGQMGYPAVTAEDRAQIEAVMAPIAPVRAVRAAEAAEVERVEIERANLQRQADETSKAQQAADNKAAFDAAVAVAVRKELAKA